jgi:hypothetical protein
MMRRKSSKAMAALLGLRRISGSDYYESEPDDQSKVTIACHSEGEFHKIGEYATGNKRMIAIYVSSMDAIYLSCADGQFLVNRDGSILSAPGDVYKIRSLNETGINRNITLLQVAIGEDEQNVAIVRRDSSGGYKWGLLFPPGEGVARIGGFRNEIARRGCDVLFLETLARARGYSYTVPLLVNGASEMIFLHKVSDSYESQEYEIWKGGVHIWTIEVGSPIKYVSFLPGHPSIAHVRCRCGEGLIDVERKETLLPTEYRKLSMDDIDYMYAVTHDGVRCLYSLEERRWAVPPGDQWSRSEKGKGCRAFMGGLKRKVVFCYKEKELKA